MKHYNEVYDPNIYQQPGGQVNLFDNYYILAWPHGNREILTSMMRWNRQRKYRRG